MSDAFYYDHLERVGRDKRQLDNLTHGSSERKNTALDELWKAEHAARVCELNGDEGTADSIRRDAIRSLLGLAAGEEMYATRELQEKHRGC